MSRRAITAPTSQRLVYIRTPHRHWDEMSQQPSPSLNMPSHPDASATGQQYFQAVQPEAMEDSDSDDPSARMVGKRSRSSRPGACIHCKSLKVRCEYTPGQSRCKRCTLGNHECMPRSRKRRKAAATQEDLQHRSREQDTQIEALLHQLDSLRLDAKVQSWIQRAQATINVGGLIARPVSPVTCHYYSRLIGPLEIDLSPHTPFFQQVPVLLRAGILAPFEVLDLFNLHFERINPFFSLLDGEVHCPQKLMWTSQFLFTVICACASRYYTRRPGLYELMMEIARDAASEALIQGPKTVETVQAFLLLAVYPIPEKKWVDSRSWLFVGAAISIAQEIQLDKPSVEPDERSNINRVRTWINCFCVDSSHAAQDGKMNMVQIDDYLVRTSVRSWYKSTESAPYDIGLCAYAEMLLLLADFRKSTGFSNELSQRFADGFDVIEHAIEFDRRFADLSSFWTETLNADPNVALCPVIRYRVQNFRMVSSYMRLVILSVGFQYAVKKGITRDSYILQHSIDMAQTVIQTVIDRLYPSGFLSWAIEANFVYMAFSAAFLLNLLRPKFLPLLTTTQCGNIVRQVQKLIQILGSEDVVLDRYHSPAVYSKFLATLLERYYTPSMQTDVGTASELSVVAQYRPEPVQSPPLVYSWPDTTRNLNTPEAVQDKTEGLTVYTDHVVRQEVGELDMDFSLSHFVQSACNSPVDSYTPDQAFGLPPNTLEGLHHYTTPVTDNHPQNMFMPS